MADYAVVLYGHGGKLGDFKQFADDLLVTDLRRFRDAKAVEVKKTVFRDEFFAALNGFDDTRHKIKELHVFSHAIGAGLFLAYGHPTLDAERVALLRRLKGRQPTYLEVVKTERGAVLTDDLVRSPYAGYRAALRAKFAAGATVKVWGCNAGVKNHVYSDEIDASRDLWTSDPTATAKFYYWRALNEQNVPKPSIAQALADYFGIPTKGALSGANIEVKTNGKWLNADEFKKKAGHYPGPKAILRLQPSKGTYSEFQPATP